MAVLNLEKHCLKILISQNQYQKQLKLLNSASRSEEHTSELQTRGHIVCRLLHEKKTRGALPKKSCLEVSAAQNSSIYCAWRVPDTFFSSKLTRGIAGTSSFTRRVMDMKTSSSHW